MNDLEKVFKFEYKILFKLFSFKKTETRAGVFSYTDLKYSNGKEWTGNDKNRITYQQIKEMFNEKELRKILNGTHNKYKVEMFSKKIEKFYEKITYIKTYEYKETNHPKNGNVIKINGEELSVGTLNSDADIESLKKEFNFQHIYVGDLFIKLDDTIMFWGNNQGIKNVAIYFIDKLKMKFYI